MLQCENAYSVPKILVIKGKNQRRADKYILCPPCMTDAEIEQFAKSVGGVITKTEQRDIDNLQGV